MTTTGVILGAVAAGAATALYYRIKEMDRCASFTTAGPDQNAKRRVRTQRLGNSAFNHAAGPETPL